MCIGQMACLCGLLQLLKEELYRRHVTLRYVTLSVLFNDAVNIRPVIEKLSSMEQLLE